MKAKAMLPVDAQTSIEYHYARAHIDKRIEHALLNLPENAHYLEAGAQLLEDWLHADHSHIPLKAARIAELQGMDIERMVLDVLITVAYCQRPELFVSVSAKLAARLKLSDHADCLRSMGEILGLLCQTDAYDITKASKDASMMVESRLYLPQEVVDSAIRSRYLPPMVCTPNWQSTNFRGAYLTFNKSVILGRRNLHSDDICLDVLNTQNYVPLSLNVDFLQQVTEVRSKPCEDWEQERLWQQFLADSQDTYRLMLTHGNKFYLEHKYDTRGRMYCSGYHITAQGSPYKKAMLEFADKELVEGVPNGSQESKETP